jgi:hypothetical protein
MEGPPVVQVFAAGGNANFFALIRPLGVFLKVKDAGRIQL